MALRRNKFQTGDMVSLIGAPKDTYIVRQVLHDEVNITYSYRLDCGWKWEKDLVLVRTHQDMLLSNKSTSI